MQQYYHYCVVKIIDLIFYAHKLILLYISMKYLLLQQ